MAALLTSVKDDKDKTAVYLDECRRMGITVLPPDVNASDADFTPVGNDIRFGLSAVRNVGENVVASIVATRKAKGAFTDFADFLRKVDPVVCNKQIVESLIKAGAFDSLGHSRRGLIARLRAGGGRLLAAKTEGGERPVRPVRVGGLARRGPGRRRLRGHRAPGEWDKTVLLAFEREMLGPLRLRPSAVRGRARAGRGGGHVDRDLACRRGRATASR